MSVVWAEHDGNRIEQLLGVMLCRRLPHANRIRPSQGDGGIDVLAPVGDGRADVYQVKGFTRSLTDSQKRQVKRSVDRVAGNERIQVRDWHLAVPLNPTPEGLFDWFRELTEPYGFACHWFGLDQCDGLASEYPEVERYYLGDGEHRLAQAISDMRQMARLTNPVEGEQVLTPADLEAPVVAALAAINAEDPHFRWAMHVDRYPPFEADPDRSPVFSTPPDGLPLVTVAAHQVSDDGWVTWFIYARYWEALEDRPIQTTFAVPVDEDGRLADPQAAAWAQYGTGGVFDVDLLSMNSPDGFALTGATAARLRVIPDPLVPHGDGAYDLRIAVTTADGRVLAETPFRMRPVTVGVGPDAGSRAHGASHGGAVTVELLSHGDGTHTIKFDRRPITGLEPAAILTDVRFLHALNTEDGQIRVGPLHGPLTQTGQPFPGGANLVNDQLSALVEALAAIQSQRCGTLRMPDLDGDDLTEDTVRAALTAHALLDGRGVLAPYTEQPLAARGEERAEMIAASEPVRVETVGTWRAEVFGCEFDIDNVAVVLTAAVIGPGEDDDTVIARPANGDNRMYMWVSPDGVLPHHLEENAAEDPTPSV